MFEPLEIVGYIAAVASIVAYAMRTMLPLRMLMVCSSVLFIVYAFYKPVYPTLFVHLILLPFNVYRLVEILRLNRAAKEARIKPMTDFNLFKRIGRHADYADGAYLFHKGDPPDYVYFIESGEIVLEEIGITLGPNEIVGEMAFFTDAAERSASARCQGRVQVKQIDDNAFMRQYFQSPVFALAIQKLITRRLMEHSRLYGNVASRS